MDKAAARHPQGRHPARRSRRNLVKVTRTLLLGAMAVVLSASPLGGSGRGGGRAEAAEGTPNACGCYQDSTGSCYCGKKARCGCPGACEPKGCEEKREKEIRKEIEAETKKAQQAGRRYSQSSGAETGGRATGEGAGAEDRPAAHKTKVAQEHKSTAHMTAGQKKELLRLLDLYAAERADHAGRTIDQVRGELTTAPR